MIGRRRDSDLDGRRLVRHHTRRAIATERFGDAVYRGQPLLGRYS
jgi:hypothetical protein